MSRTEFELDAFLKLPRKCQLMFFEFFDENNFGKYVSDSFGYVTECCKSPIEMIFLYAFENVIKQSNYNKLALEPQFPVCANGKNYIVDFMFDTNDVFKEHYKSENSVKLVIECDGHEYHKTTKEQVKRENERDYNLKFAGYDVIHFSGSQIYNDSIGCAKQIIKYIEKKAGKIEVLEE